MTRSTSRAPSLRTSIVGLLIVFLAAAVVVAIVTVRAKSNAERAEQESRREFETVEQELTRELQITNELAESLADRASDLEDEVAQARALADRNDSRWMAAVAVSGQHSPATSRLLALDAIRRSPTQQARAALGTVLFADPRASAPIVKVAHEGPVWDVAVSPDGELVASASGDGTVGLWESSTGIQRAALRHDADIWTVRFSSAGTELLTASSDGSALLWSIASGEILLRMEHDERVNDARFSPDGTTVVTASHDGLASLWDLESGTKVLDLQHLDVVWDAAFSADGERVATVGGDGITRLFSLPDGEVLADIDHGKPTEVLSFSPDGQFLFAGGQGTMHFLDAVTGAVLFSPTEGGRAGVLAIDWHPDGTEAAVVSLGSGITRFDLTTGEVLANHRQAGGVRDVLYSPDGEWLAGASGDFQFSFGEISFWDLASGERLALLNLGGPVGALAVDATSSSLVASYRATVNQIEVGGAWIVPAERQWLTLACEGTDGLVPESTWADIVGPDEPFVRTCP